MFRQFETVTVSRQKLYGEIWKTAAYKLAKKYGVSDVTIGKICRKHDIPKPTLGYWARVRHGQSPKRLPLPPLKDQALAEIKFTVCTNPEPKPARDPDIVALIASVRLAAKRITVEENLTSPHPLIELTMRSLNAAVADGQGLLRPKAKRTLDVAVGKFSIDRAMRIMDALVKGLQSRGIKFWVDTEDEFGGETHVEILGEQFDLRMTEHLAKGERALTAEEQENHRRAPQYFPSVRYMEYPSGLLSLSYSHKDLYNRRRWSDKDGRKIELRLNGFIIGLYKSVEAIRQKRIELEIWAKQCAEDERVRKIEAARERREQKRIKRLNKQVAAWDRTCRLRGYLSALEKAFARKDGQIDPESKIGRWLRWARLRADSIDPVVRLMAKVEGGGA